MPETPIVLLNQKCLGVELSIDIPTNCPDLGRYVAEKLELPVRILHDGGRGINHTVGPIYLEALQAIPWEVSELQLPAAFRPWQRPGWQDRAVEWWQSQTGFAGEVTQVGSYDLACVLKAQGMYFKAGDKSKEAAFASLIAEHQPKITVAILAYDLHNDWLVTQDGGARLSESADLEHWQAAARNLAGFHKNFDPQILLNQGCPVYKFDRLAKQFVDWLNSKDVLAYWGITQSQLDKLETLLPWLLEAHEHAINLGISETATHGDAQPMNALVSGGCWFDWSEAGMAHPITDLGWLLAWVGHSARSTFPIRQKEPRLLEKILEEYATQLAQPNLLLLLPEIQALAMMHRILAYHQKYQYWQGSLGAWKPNFVAYYVKLLLGTGRYNHLTNL